MNKYDGLLSDERVWIALDVSTVDEAKRLIDILIPLGIRNFKIGLELIIAGFAHEVMKYIKSVGAEFFLDGKFNDIPHTVGKAAKNAAALGAKMFNLHANCGARAIKAAVDNKGESLVLAVTLLTSLEGSDLVDLGFPMTTSTQFVVKTWASLAAINGADGIICSPQEISVVREVMPEGFILTPGVRPSWSQSDDQKRTMTPGGAIRAGATALVIGRPITNPPTAIGGIDVAVRLIEEEITLALV